MSGLRRIIGESWFYFAHERSPISNSWLSVHREKVHDGGSGMEISGPLIPEFEHDLIGRCTGSVSYILKRGPGGFYTEGSARASASGHEEFPSRMSLEDVLN